jgi:hypothetical protein
VTFFGYDLFMPITQEDVIFEDRQAKLAAFLKGKPIEEEPSEEDFQNWNAARVMLRGPELLQACEYALTVISMISSEEFTAGGDKPARLMLEEAIAKAKDGIDREEQQSLETRCAQDIRHAVEYNRATVL